MVEVRHGSQIHLDGSGDEGQAVEISGEECEGCGRGGQGGGTKTTAEMAIMPEACPVGNGGGRRDGNVQERAQVTS